MTIPTEKFGVEIRKASIKNIDVYMYVDIFFVTLFSVVFFTIILNFLLHSNSIEMIKNL